MIKKLYLLTLRNGYKFTSNYYVINATIHSCPQIKFETSFAYMILQYFKNDPKYVTYKITDTVKYTLPKNEIKSILNNEKKISSLDMDEILKYILIISCNFSDVQKVMKNVDREICKRLNEDKIFNNYVELLKVTDALIYFTHNRVNLISCYTLCIENIKTVIKKEEITLAHLIQCVFYISMLKSHPLARSTMKLILGKVHLQTKIFDLFSPIELLIFCNSIYKSSTKILSKKTLKAIVNALDKEADRLFTSEVLFINLLKPFYQAKYHDYELLEKLSDKITTKKDIDLNNYSFTSTVYFIKLFSNALYSNENLIHYLADHALVTLDKMYKNKEYIRAKDVSILLKSFCELGYDSLKKPTIETVLPILNDAYDKFQIKKNEQQCLAEIILWLNILDVCDKTFLDKVVDTKLIIKGKSKHSGKSISRMNLLLTILSIEKLLPSNKLRDLMKLVETTEGHDQDQLFSAQPSLRYAFQAVQCLSSTNLSTIKQANIDFQIPNLYIPGITVETKSCKISIEIFDKKTCLHNTLIPNGYMKLKLRLLKKTGYEILIVKENEVKEGSEYLFTTIEDGIKKIEQMTLFHKN